MEKLFHIQIGDTQDVSFVFDTLNQLPTIEAPCILHSDQGAVYTSHSYQTQVKNKGIAMSMSRKGTPADNAPIESFHSTLKSETFYLFPELCSSSEIVSQTVINFIEYYNETQIQAKLGYVSPVEFRLQAYLFIYSPISMGQSHTNFFLRIFRNYTSVYDS